MGLAAVPQGASSHRDDVPGGADGTGDQKSGRRNAFGRCRRGSYGEEGFAE
jgi:hypothetical protein